MGDKSSKKKSTRFELMVSETPFANMTENEIEEQIDEIADKANAQFQHDLVHLSNLITKLDPFLALSHYALYALSYDGIRPETESPIAITQHHIEFLQAFILQHQLQDFHEHPAVGEEVEMIVERLFSLSLSFQLKRFKVVKATMTAVERRRFGVQEYMRISTQNIRNWGYSDQMERLLKELFRPIDENVEQKLGVRIEHLLNMCFSLIRLAEDRITKHIQKIKLALQSSNPRRMLEKYANGFLIDKTKMDSLLEESRSKSWTHHQLRTVLIMHSDLFLPDLFTFTLDDLADLYSASVEQESLKKIMLLWSMPFGELAGNNTEHFFLANPIWNKPFIRSDENTFFCPIVGALASFCFDLMEAVIQDDKQLWESYENRRGKFLEEAVFKLAISAFPSGQIFRGSLYPDETGTNIAGENDILVILDTHAIVIEAKAGRVRSQARRGAIQTMQSDVGKLITDASEQAHRFIDFVQQHPIFDYSTKSGVVNKVDASKIEHFVPLNVTLESLGALSAYTPALIEADLIKPGTALIPSMSLADFETIIHILDHPLQTIHYLRWRTHLEKTLDYAADEIDLLAVYIRDGFAQNQVLTGEFSAWFYGESELFNPYFMRFHHKQSVVKPQRRLTNWWKNLLTQIEQSQVENWTDLGCLLLNVSFNQQLLIERKLRTNTRKLKRVTTQTHLSEAVLISNDVFLLIAYRTEEKQEKTLVEDLARLSLQDMSMARVGIISLNVDREDYPASSIFLMEYGEDSQ